MKTLTGLSESSKITLTLEQLKRLVRESTSDDFVWDENLIFTPEMIDEFVAAGKVELDAPSLKRVADKVSSGDYFKFAVSFNLKPTNVKSDHFWILVVVDIKLKAKYIYDDPGHNMADGWTVDVRDVPDPMVRIPDEYDYEAYALPFTRATQKSVLTALAGSKAFKAWMEKQCEEGMKVKLGLWDCGHFVGTKQIEDSIRNTYKFLFDTFFDALELEPQPLKRPEIPSAQDVEDKKRKDKEDQERHERQHAQDMQDYYARAARYGTYTGD